MNGIKRIEFNSKGFREVLFSDGVKSFVTETANSIRDKANANLNEESEGFVSNTFGGGYGGGRWVAVVSTTDLASMKAEAEDKALSKAVG